jgi:CBS domain-containing protein
VHNFLERSAASHMTRNVKTVTRGMTIHELGGLFAENDFNSFPVEEDSRVIGIVSKFDYLANFEFTPAELVPNYQELMKRTVGDVMVHEFIYVQTETKLTRVLHLMIDHRIRSMPVIEADRRLVGIISREDVIGALQACA